MLRVSRATAVAGDEEAITGLECLDTTIAHLVDAIQQIALL